MDAKHLFLAIIISAPCLADNSLAPALQWVLSLTASAPTFATASAVDAEGNLYIAGRTSALDFPTTSAGQPQTGGTPLTRVDTVSGAVVKLRAPLLEEPTAFANRAK